MEQQDDFAEPTSRRTSDRTMTLTLDCAPHAGPRSGGHRALSLCTLCLPRRTPRQDHMPLIMWATCTILSSGTSHLSPPIWLPRTALSYACRPLVRSPRAADLRRNTSGPVPCMLVVVADDHHHGTRSPVDPSTAVFSIFFNLGRTAHWELGCAEMQSRIGDGLWSRVLFAFLDARILSPLLQ